MNIKIQTMKHPKRFRSIFIPCLIIAVGVICTMLNSCKSAKIRHATTTFDRYAMDGAKYCLSKYPAKERIVRGKPVFTKGRTDTVTLDGETVYINCDSAIASAWDEAGKKHVGLKCPSVVNINHFDTIAIHDSTYVLDGKEMAIKDSIVSQVQARYDKCYSAKETVTKWAIGEGVLLLLLALYGAWRMYSSSQRDAVRNAGKLG
jgi:hypothetical protein